MKRRAVFFALCGCLTLIGCGGSSPSSILNPAPVQAQATYSDASVNGTYSIFLVRGDAESEIGSFKADGTGNISSGSLTANLGVTGGNACSVNLSGTYTLQSSAAGTGTITTAAPGSGTTCNYSLNPMTLHFLIQAGQQGNVLLFTSSDNQMYSGSAVKQ
jgi:hypothetical protein